MPAAAQQGAQEQGGYNASRPASGGVGNLHLMLAHGHAVKQVLHGGIMTESEFLTLAEALLDTIEAQVDEWYDELDIDVEASRSGNVLTLAFDNGVRVIVNSQAPLHEMWVAAPSGGFHYRLQDGIWQDTRGGPALGDALSTICSDAAEQPLVVTLA